MKWTRVTCCVHVDRVINGDTVQSVLLSFLIGLKSGGLSRACRHGQRISTFLELVLVLIQSQQQQNLLKILTKMVQFFGLSAHGLHSTALE